ncbi:9437_t:CDS:1 [Ambispora gerdemannii]|uniref:9437_t:CDS:1 n=1 Tax=Ambispora gerdemannii TaxID=144530 RepID=A0A9N9F4M2_9GLOM|nr:9437_t:CDS:1 [Ambispora gerdemannii]
MPSTNTTVIPTAASDATNKMKEYEVIVFSHGTDSNNATETSSDDNSSFQQPLRAAKTKHITCNGQSGQMFWIPEGYRPLLVRTADLPLLVGAEFPLSPGLSSDEESN